MRFLYSTVDISNINKNINKLPVAAPISTSIKWSQEKRETVKQKLNYLLKKI